VSCQHAFSWHLVSRDQPPQLWEDFNIEGSKGSTVLIEKASGNVAAASYTDDIFNSNNLYRYLNTQKSIPLKIILILQLLILLHLILVPAQKLPACKV